MRPTSLEDYVGQQHLLGEGRPLRRLLANQQLQSLLFWGPPGVGKTSLARLLANNCDLPFYGLSAVMCSTKDIRAIVNDMATPQFNTAVVFLDEIHRFNKAQQDALLPYVEDGRFILIGATTENPSFNVNKALLSRMQLYRLEALQVEDIERLLSRAVMAVSGDIHNGHNGVDISVAADVLKQMAVASQGDARKALNLLELAAAQVESDGVITMAILERCVETIVSMAMDRQGDVFYELISALHKAVRGSSPDAALYWLARMLEGGCDPLYIARRVVRMASEDIGNADPRALTIALNAWEAQERLGSPEGELALAQAVSYLSVAAKSNAVYAAFKAASQLAKQTGQLPVPMHLRNAPTKLMQQEGYGRDYQYAHDYPEGYVPGESYWPEPLAGTQLYEPVNRGLETQIAEKLKRHRKLDAESSWRRADSSHRLE